MALSFFRLQKRRKNYVFPKGKSGKLTKGREGQDDVRLVQLVVDAAHVDAACCTRNSRLFCSTCQPNYQLVLPDLQKGDPTTQEPSSAYGTALRNDLKKVSSFSNRCQRRQEKKGEDTSSSTEKKMIVQNGGLISCQCATNSQNLVEIMTWFCYTSLTLLL
jgi:hypothetical protein